MCRLIQAPNGGTNTNFADLIVSLGKANDEVSLDGLSAKLALSTLEGDDTVNVGQVIWPVWSCLRCV